MPLSILLPLVVFGIAGIAVLLHLMGKSRRLAFETVADVERHWHNQYPKFWVERVVMSKGGHHALVDSNVGVGLVWSMGADAACRLLENDATVRETERGLTIATGDYTAPTIFVALPDQNDRRLWTGMITGEAKWQT